MTTRSTEPSASRPSSSSTSREPQLAQLVGMGARGVAPRRSRGIGNSRASRGGRLAARRMIAQCHAAGPPDRGRRWPRTRSRADTAIWHFAHVMPGARIGDRCSIGQGCFVGEVPIGDGCRIQNHVSVFDGVTLEDDVFLGPSCVFTNVKHPRAHVSRKDEYARTLVCKRRDDRRERDDRVRRDDRRVRVDRRGRGGHARRRAARARRRRTGAAWSAGRAAAARRCDQTLACARCGDIYHEDRGALVVSHEGGSLTCRYATRRSRDDGPCRDCGYVSADVDSRLNVNATHATGSLESASPVHGHRSGADRATFVAEESLVGSSGSGSDTANYRP